VRETKKKSPQEKLTYALSLSLSRERERERERKKEKIEKTFFERIL